jgi:LPS export ABC transporter protein LptC
MKPKKLGIAIFLVAIVGLGLGSIFYTMYRLRNHQEFLSDYSPRIEQIEKAKGETITLTETTEGSRKWVLKMKEMKYSKDKSSAVLTGIQGIVYGDSQKVLAIFEAPNGEFFKNDNRVILTEGVKMISPSTKVRIQAPKMDWSSKTGVVIATGGVVMAKEGFGSSRAQRAEFAMDFSRIQFSGNTASVIGGHPKTGD